MGYPKLVESIPVEKWGMLIDKLADFILTSKNDEKMLGPLANMILHHHQQGVLRSVTGLAALLQAALLLEPEKTINAFNELQMPKIAQRLKDELES